MQLRRVIGAQHMAAIEFSEEDRIWLRARDVELLARVYSPAVQQRSGVTIVDVHGGAWSSGDRLVGQLCDRALAARGHTVVAIDFRHAPKYQHPSASRDVASAVRWVRRNAAELGSGTIALMGSSSGGHLAMLAGTCPDAPAHADGTLEDASVDCVAALWPVSDPFYRYRYAKRAGLKPLVAATESYYGTEDAMREASVPRVIVAGEANRLPPLLVVQPGEDSNVPIEMTFDLVRAYQSRGGRVDYAYFPEQAHGFGHRPSSATSEMVTLIDDFVRRATERGR
jgi:acetyl esterase/lipase